MDQTDDQNQAPSVPGVDINQSSVGNLNQTQPGVDAQPVGTTQAVPGQSSGVPGTNMNQSGGMSQPQSGMGDQPTGTVQTSPVTAPEPTVPTVEPVEVPVEQPLTPPEPMTSVPPVSTEQGEDTGTGTPPASAI